jgi:hypothetical protein
MPSGAPQGAVVYFAVGGIKDLVDWFNANADGEKLLCLYVPNDRKDESLLGDLFDSRGLISPQLKEIAFCLFSSRATMNELRARSPEWSDFLFVPGLVGVANLPNHWRNWRRVDPTQADIVPREVREEVLLRSQAIATEIVDYFQIADTDPPCLVFVARNDSEPFVIRTQGSANLSIVRELFRDLDRVSALVSDTGMLSLPTLIAWRYALARQRAALDADLQELQLAAARALVTAADAASSYGVSDVIRGIDPRMAHHLFRYLGLPHKDKRPLYVSPDTRAAATAALLDPAVHKALREAVTAGKRRRKAEIDREGLDQRIRENDRKLDRGSLENSLDTVEDEINTLCAKYEARFRRASRYMTLRRFIMVITGAAKAVESFTTSIGSTADNIAKGLP